MTGIPVHKARRQSKCPGCGEWIREGDDIALEPDGEWVCESCADEVTP